MTHGSKRYGLRAEKAGDDQGAQDKGALLAQSCRRFAPDLQVIAGPSIELLVTLHFRLRSGCLFPMPSESTPSQNRSYEAPNSCLTKSKSPPGPNMRAISTVVA